jgi:hypothetical protein
MENNLLYQKISSLPPHKKQEVEAFIDSILKKKDKKTTGKKAKAGSGKGLFVIKPGFDEPLEDFKEYME